VLPAGVVDPHIHLWNPFTTRREVSPMARLFRPLPRIPRFLGRIAPQPDREFVGDPQHVLKPYLPPTYRADAGDVTVATVVHVESTGHQEERRRSVDETRWVVSQTFGPHAVGTDGLPELGALVVHVDPRFDDAAAILDEHLAVSPLVRGVRCVAAHHPDPGVRDFTDHPHLLSDPAFLSGFAAIAERDLGFEIWCYAHQLPDALTLVREYPDTTFVLDHYGSPVGLTGPRGRHTGRTEAERTSMLGAWRDDVAALAEHPNVVAKHSGLGMPVLGSDVVDPDRVAPLIRHLHDVFGPDRTLWASNFPMDKANHTLPASLRLVTAVLGSDADLEKLVRDVATRVYRL